MRTTQADFAVGLNHRPLYSTLVQFPVVCFVGALFTDVAYARTALYLWESFSVWLLAAGCVFAGLAGIVGLFIFLGDRRARAMPLAWPYALTSLAAAVLAVFNTFVHSRDGYTAVVPTGLTLSCIVVALMLVATFIAWNAPRRTVILGDAA